MNSETAGRPTFVLIVRVPLEGVTSFQSYEDAVLPLLPEFGGRLGGVDEFVGVGRAGA
jgi:hypothetical protein